MLTSYIGGVGRLEQFGPIVLLECEHHQLVCIHKHNIIKKLRTPILMSSLLAWLRRLSLPTSLLCPVVSRFSIKICCVPRLHLVLQSIDLSIWEVIYRNWLHKQSVLSAFVKTACSATFRGMLFFLQLCEQDVLQVSVCVLSWCLSSSLDPSGKQLYFAIPFEC